MKQFTLLPELCQKTQKPLQSRDNSKSNPGKMKIRRTSIRNPGQKHDGSDMQTTSAFQIKKSRGTEGVVKYDGLRKEKSQTNVLSIRFIVPFICYNPTTTQKEEV